jgi:hypothetical protein
MVRIATDPTEIGLRIIAGCEVGHLASSPKRHLLNAGER